MIKTISIMRLIKILILLSLTLLAKEDYSINIFPFKTSLQVFYKVKKFKNGYDIEYLFKNSSNKSLEIPDIKVGYIHLKAKNRIYVLNTANSLNLELRNIKKNIWINGSKELYYPISYSPVIVAADSKNAFGASIKTNFLKDRWAIGGKIEKNKFGYIFIFTNENKKSLNPKESFKISISFRKTPKNRWLESLKPYREYFNKQFAKNYPPKDTRAILGLDISYIGAAGDKNNKRGYNYHTRLDLYGLTGENEKYKKSFLKSLIESMRKNGFQRVMLWGISGEYFENCKKKHCEDTNYPPQFISNLPRKLSKSIDKIKTLKKYGIDYGFWWGRSGEIPIKNFEVIKPWDWNPDSLVPLNPLKKEHFRFAVNEMDTAYKLKAKEIGLDAYLQIDPKFQIKWLDFLKERYKNIKFWIEGSVTDYLHTRASLFLQPENEFFNPLKIKISKPPALAEYLNPNAEIIIYLHTYDKNYIKKLINLGFTPLVVPFESNIIMLLL